MTSQSHLYSSTSSTTAVSLIFTADGSQMTKSQYGQISTSALILPNTFLIPKLTFNLISVGKLCELGLELIFSPNGCRVQDPRTKQLLGTGRRVGRLFELTSLHLPSVRVSQLCAMSTPYSLYLWHLRLGYTSLSKLRHLISNGSLGSVKEQTLHYVSCQLGKQPALSFNSNNAISVAPLI